MIKKAPRWITCALWGLAALRLVCPVSPESAFSLLPSREVIPEDIQMADSPQIDSGIPMDNHTETEYFSSALENYDGSMKVGCCEGSFIKLYG